MKVNELKNIWREEENRTFKGWDFSYLRGRWDDEELPWDYEKILRYYLKSEYKLLDMGTGGGEFLLTLKHLAKIIEWEFPGFSVESSFEELCKLHNELKDKPYIESIEHRFIMVCRKLS